MRSSEPSERVEESLAQDLHDHWQDLNGLYNGIQEAELLRTKDIISKSPQHDVRAYGAIGDGATDDYTAINDTLTAATNGGTVVFPIGHYKHGTKLTIPKGVKLKGYSHHFAASDEGSKLEYTGAGFGIQTDDCSILENLTIESNASGVALYGSQAVMRDCTVTAAYGTGGAGTIGVQFSDGQDTAGTPDNPSYYCAMENCRVRSFAIQVKMLRYANGNYIRNGQLHRAADMTNA
ncbi:unnamed protein product, partial [marine sediment metagenome]